LVWIFFALPMIPIVGLRLDSFSTAVVGLSLNLGAFVAEIVRAGLEGVPRQHIEAATMARFSRLQLWRYILAPLVLRFITPPLFGQMISQVKLSVLASVIAVPELLHTVNTISNDSSRPLESYTALAISFLLLLLPSTWLQTWIEHTLKGKRQLAMHAETSPLELITPAVPDLADWPILAGSGVIVTGLTICRNDAPVVSNVSATFRPGTITALIGSNGSGKTTLLRAIAGLLSSTSGSINVGSPGASMGFLFQEHEPWPHLSVMENVSIPLCLVCNMPPDDARRLGQQWLRLFDLEQYASRRATDLSGGQKQRLALARVLCLRPEVVLLDEPTSAMDFRWALRVQRLLRNLADHGVCIIVVSHGMGCLKAVSDEIVFLDGGVVIEAGSAEQLLSCPQTPELGEFLAAA
jgi:polar amino acid transport system permease protein